MAKLSEAPLVMIWRRVADLLAIGRQTHRLNAWPSLGQDTYSSIYDAGNVLLAYWNQTDYLTRGSTDPDADPSPQPSPIQTKNVFDNSQCTVVNQAIRAEAFNSSNQLTLATNDGAAVQQRLSTLVGYPVNPVVESDSLGSSFSFVDEVGNTTRWVEVNGTGPALKRRLKALEENDWSDGTGNPAIFYELLVADFPAALIFYRDVLGLKVLESTPSSARFDTGALVLTIRQEPAVGLVGSLRQSGKLHDDLAVFHVDDVQATVDALKIDGMSFPRGIEDSDHGRLATFEDLDGHSLSIWQPPPRLPAPDIDYFPVLDRLLAAASPAPTGGGPA